MFINYYQNYLAMIQNSVGSHTYRNLVLEFDDGSSKDILRGWNESCAFYVSCILRLYNLSWATFANVLSLEKHCLEYGRNNQNPSTNPNDIIPWSIIIREKRLGTTKLDQFGNDRTANYHIGFYIGNEEAISNYSDGFQDWKAIDKPLSPWRHHYLYHWERSIKSILSFPFSMNIQQFISQDIYHFLINKQLEIPFVGMTEAHLNQYGFTEEEKDRALGRLEWLEIGRMCGAACVTMAYQYFNKDKNKTLKDCVQFRDKIHTKWLYRDSQNGWYHDGLIAIATGRWLSGTRWNADTGDTKIIKKLIADCIDNKKVLLLSVSPWFDSNKKWWHLVVVRWYNYNGYTEELIINDPLDPKANEWYPWAPTAVRLSDIMQCRSGKYIIISMP